MADGPSNFVSYAQLVGLNQDEIDRAKQAAFADYNTKSTDAANQLANAGSSAVVNAQNGGSGDITATVSYGDYLKSKDAMSAAYKNLTTAHGDNFFDKALSSAEVDPNAKQADLSAWKFDQSQGGATSLSDLEKQWGLSAQQSKNSKDAQNAEVATSAAHTKQMGQQYRNEQEATRSKHNQQKQALIDAWMADPLGGKKYGSDLQAQTGDQDWIWRQAQNWAASMYGKDENVKGLVDDFQSTGKDDTLGSLVSGGQDAVDAARNSDYSYTKGWFGLGNWEKTNNTP